MLVRAVKSINSDKQNRIEFLITDFDYRDGIDFIATLFEKEYKTKIVEETDGLWYRILKIRKGSEEYCLVWHEDIGNYIYCSEQSKELVYELEKMLDVIIARLNTIFGRKDDTHKAYRNKYQ